MIRALTVSLVLLAAAPPAVAQRKAAPEPAKPVPAAIYAGRWYEIARTPNERQKTCQAPTVDFTTKGTQRSFSLTCREGSPAGKSSTRTGRMTLIDGARNAKFKANFFAGFGATYYVLDRAEDSSWALLGTSGGNFVWVLSRTPTLTPAARAAAVARAGALGYAGLEFPKQPPA
jgi:apolipoprotein D and lipocalin family protein